PSGVGDRTTTPGAIALGAVSWLLLYALWASIRAPYEHAWEFIVDEAAILPLRVAVALLAFRVARAPGIPAPMALGWRLVGAAFALGAVSNLARVVLAAGQPQSAIVRLGFAIPYAVLLLAGLWQLARRRPGEGSAAD